MTTAGNTGIDPIKYGALYQQVQDLRNDVQSMKDDIKDLKGEIKELVALANKSRGGLWFGITIVSSFSAIVAIVTTFFGHFRGH